MKRLAVSTTKIFSGTKTPLILTILTLIYRSTAFVNLPNKEESDSLAERFYGVPTDYSHRRTSRRDAPQILEFAQEDELDAVILVPL